MAKKILKNEILFHAVHGICRVVAVTRTPPSKDFCYSLLPVPQSRSKSRFAVPGDLLESSGFNRMVSAKEAVSILEYLKTGEKKESTVGNAWVSAVTLRTESRSKEILKDKRKAQQLNLLVKSFTNELAIVLQSTVQETRTKIQENLSPVSKINPAILTALANVDAV